MASTETIEQVNKRFRRQVVALSVLAGVFCFVVGFTANLVEVRLHPFVYAFEVLLYVLLLVAAGLQAKTARRRVQDYMAAQSEVERETRLLSQVVSMLADSSGTPYWLWHPSGQFELHGPWLEHVGIEAHLLNHDEFFETVVSRSSVEEAFKAAQRQAKPVSRIVARDLGDGEVRTIIATVFPVRRMNTDLLLMIGSSVEIDNQLKSQNKLSAALAVVKAERAFMGAICATMQEQLSTAESAVQRARTLPLSRSEQDMTNVAESMNRVRQMVDHAKELYAAYAQTKPVRAEVPLAAVFDLAVREASRKAPPFKIEINPPLPADRPVAGDPDAIRRILEILIMNAATDGHNENDYKSTVRVKYIEGPQYKLDVITVGPKVSPLDLSYLGEPFYGVNPRERVDPWGVRLAIAKALATANDARLTFGNSHNEEEGLIASIEIPLADGHD